MLDAHPAPDALARQPLPATAIDPPASPARPVAGDALFAAARTLLPVLEAGRPLDAAILRDAMTRAFGGSDASGAWVRKDAYEAAEAAAVLFLQRYGKGMLMILRWLPGRDFAFVGDSSFGTHELAHAVGQHATLVSRLRLDASLFAPPEPRTPRQLGRPRLKGKPLAKLQTKLDDPDANWTPIMLPVCSGDKKEKELEILTGTALWHRTGRPKTIRWVLVRDPLGQREPQAFFSTDTGMEAERILAIYVRRWQIEVTFQEVRAHLGIETQRQWSDLAIERTTPALLGLYSLICLWAGKILAKTAGPFKAAWYEKSVFTFSDAIAAVRTQIWLNCIFQRSPPDRERRKIQPIGNPNRLVCGLADEKDLLMAPPGRLKSMIETLCYAA